MAEQFPPLAYSAKTYTFSEACNNAAEMQPSAVDLGSAKAIERLDHVFDRLKTAVKERRRGVVRFDNGELTINEVRHLRHLGWTVVCTIEEHVAGTYHHLVEIWHVQMP